MHREHQPCRQRCAAGTHIMAGGSSTQLSLALTALSLLCPVLASSLLVAFSGMCWGAPGIPICDYSLASLYTLCHLHADIYLLSV